MTDFERVLVKGLFLIPALEGSNLKKILYDIDDYLSTIALAGVIVLTVLNVILRFVFSAPIAWVEEVALALFIWVVFIGMSASLKRGGSIGVDYFVNKFSPKFRKIADALRYLAMYFVLIYVFIYLGGMLTEQASVKLTPVLAFSYSWIDIAIPLGGFLAFCHLTILVIKDFKSDGKESEEKQ